MNYKIEQGKEIISSNSGTAIVGKYLERQRVGKYIKENMKGSLVKKTRAFDVISSWIGLLSQGRSNYEDIALFQDDPFFKDSLHLNHLYSSSRFRQITEEVSDSEMMKILKDLNIQQLQGKDFGTLKIEQYGTEYIPCDLDVSPLDNSKSLKESVGRTYKNHDGYAPMFAYIGAEGYMLNCELRPGTQHCQKGTVAFLKEVIENLKELDILHKVVIRLDSGNDAADNIRLLNKEGVKFIIKRNLRKESQEKWLDFAKSTGEIEKPREGKFVYTGTASHITPKDWSEKDLPVEIVVKVAERSIDKKGNSLLINDIDTETYWTNLGEVAKTIINLYHDHGTSEQFHSELKSDMDVERLASGKFKTNSLILIMAMLSFNILRDIGMKMLDFKEDAPVSMNVRRKRIKSVLRDIVNIASKWVTHSGYQVMKFGKNCKWFAVFRKIYLSYC